MDEGGDGKQGIYFALTKELLLIALGMDNRHNNNYVVYS